MCPAMFLYHCTQVFRRMLGTLPYGVFGALRTALTFVGPIRWGLIVVYEFCSSTTLSYLGQVVI